jgi:hypothetical protein
VAGLSVPFRPRGPAAFIELARSIYKGRFFYQIYFQQEGVAEAELEADIAGALRKMYFALSGEAPHNKWLEPKPPEARLLDGLIDPQPFPDWMMSNLAVMSTRFGPAAFAVRSTDTARRPSTSPIWPN